MVLGFLKVGDLDLRMYFSPAPATSSYCTATDDKAVGKESAGGISTAGDVAGVLCGHGFLVNRQRSRKHARLCSIFSHPGAASRVAAGNAAVKERAEDFRGNYETLRRNDMVQIQKQKSWYISYSLYNHFCMKIDRLSKVGFPAYLRQR